MLLPDLSPAEAFVVAETIRLKVEQWCGETATTTVSIGVASLVPNAHMEWTAMVRAADEALYAAKASGRNRTVLAAGSKLSLAA